MPGMETIIIYEPVEFKGTDCNKISIKLPITIELGQNLNEGQIIGKRPTSGKYIAYDKDAVAVSTVPAADVGNTGDGTSSAIAVQDDYTLTESWTLTCTTLGGAAVGEFSVVGSVSGNVGTAVSDAEFKYPNTAAYMLKFTLTAGGTPWAIGDIFTFTTTAAGARIATGILNKKVNASLADKFASQYIKGTFIVTKLTDLDTDAKAHLLGKTVNDQFIM